MKPFNLQKFLAGEPITTLGGHEVVAFRYDTNFNDIFPLTVAIKDNTGLISNYQYSMDGNPLGTIDSNYILCMKDTELSINNNKQQTAMKLYTEQQLRRYLLDEGIMELSDLANNLVPHIELPSDEEIEDASLEENNDDLSPAEEFQRGAIWMRDKIQGGNK